MSPNSRLVFDPQAAFTVGRWRRQGPGAGRASRAGGRSPGRVWTWQDPSWSSLADEVPALAAGLLLEPDPLDGHPAVHRLAHVVDGQGRDRDRRQGLHLDAGL